MIQSVGMFKKLPLKKWVWGAAALNVFNIITLFIIKSFLPPIVPLFYGLPSGRSQLAPVMYLLMVPVISLFIVTINTGLVWRFTDQFTKKVLIAASFIVSLLSTIAVIKIVLLVGFF